MAQGRRPNGNVKRPCAYDWEYVKLRAAMRRELQPNTPCPRCGLPMNKGQKLDLGHINSVALVGIPKKVTRSMVRWEHASCNRSAGSKLGNRLRKGKGARDIRGDHKSEEW